MKVCRAKVRGGSHGALADDSMHNAHLAQRSLARGQLALILLQRLGWPPQLRPLNPSKRDELI